MQIDLTGIAASAAALIFGVGTRVIYALIEAHFKSATMRAVLENAVGNALGAMEQATQTQIANASVLHPEVDNPLVAVGVRYAIGHAQEAVDHFGLTPDALAEKIEARIGVANIATKLAISGSPLPAAPGALDPMPVFAPDSMTTSQLNAQALAAARAENQGDD